MHPLDDISVYRVGMTLKVWSNRVFGVPIWFEVTKVGRKYLHGDFRYAGAVWSGAVSPARVERVFES